MEICIAHGGDVSQPSGGTDRVTALAAGLQARDFDVTLVVPEPADQLPLRLKEVDIHPVTTGHLGIENSLIRASAITKTAQSVAESSEAVLQLEHSSLAGVGTLLGCDNFVLDMHDIAYPRFDYSERPVAPILRRGVAWLERRAVERANHIVVVSEYMQEMLLNQWNVPPERISIVPNGFFPERIEEFTSTSSKSGRVCFLGTLHPKVDIAAFEAIAQLPSVSELIIIGDGAQRDRVDKLASEYPNVLATGRLPDEEAFKHLASAEVVINPQTRSELQRSSSPVKLFYYAALGKPMVVSEGPSIVQKLAAANAARVADTRAEFVENVEYLMKSPDVRCELSQNAIMSAKGSDWGARADQLAAVYGQQVAKVPL